MLFVIEQLHMHDCMYVFIFYLLSTFYTFLPSPPPFLKSFGLLFPFSLSVWPHNGSFIQRGGRQKTSRQGNVRILEWWRGEEGSMGKRDEERKEEGRGMNGGGGKEGWRWGRVDLGQSWRCGVDVGSPWWSSNAPVCVCVCVSEDVWIVDRRARDTEVDYPGL